MSSLRHRAMQRAIEIWKNIEVDSESFERFAKKQFPL